MIIEQITISAKEGKQKELLATLVDLIKAVRKERGCKSAELYASLEQTGEIVAKIGWKDEASLRKHIEGENYKHFQEAATPLVAGSVVQLLNHVLIKDDQHPLDEIYDAVYDLSLSIPFAGPTTKRILDKVHMREVGKGFMVGFKPFYPRRTFSYIGKKTNEYLESKSGTDHKKMF